MRSVAGRNRQEMGEDGLLLAVGQIGNDEAIGGERLKVEDIDAGLYAATSVIGRSLTKRRGSPSTPL
jgi:hypothetical protein